MAFHSSGWGWSIKRPAWDRRSLLTGSSRGGPSRRDIYLGTILCPATAGQWEVVEPGPGKLSPGLPGAERSGKIHTDKASATSAPSCLVCFFRRVGNVSENLSGQWDVSQDTNRSTRASISAPPPRGGASIPRASAPVSTGFLLLYCGSPGCKLLEETTTFLGSTGGFGMPVAKWTWPQTPLVIYVGDHQCVVWVDKHMVAPEIC